MTKPESNSRPTNRAALLGIGSRSEAAWSVIFAVLCLGPLLAYLLPDQPLSSWPWAVSFCNLSAELIPGIDRLTEASTMPQVTRLFMSLQWVLAAPILTVVFLRFAAATEESVINAMRIAEARWWYFLLGPVCMLALAWFLWALPFANSPSRPTLLRYVVDAMSQSRLWLGLYGSAIAMTAAFSVVAFFKSFSLIRLAYAVRTSSPLYKKDSK